MGAAAAVAGASVTDGFNGGRDVAAGLDSACLVSTGLNAFGSGFASFGLAAAGGAGVVEAVVSAPPRPTLWARLEKKPSDCCEAAVAVATRVFAVADGAAGAAATTG